MTIILENNECANHARIKIGSLIQVGKLGKITAPSEKDDLYRAFMDLSAVITRQQLEGKRTYSSLHNGVFIGTSQWRRHKDEADDARGLISENESDMSSSGGSSLITITMKQRIVEVMTKFSIVL